MDKILSLFSGNSNILKFLLSPIRFTKCLGVRVPLRPPRKKKALIILKMVVFDCNFLFYLILIAGVQIRQWFKSLEYGVSAQAKNMCLTPVIIQYHSNMHGP
jgi:hypothetical protein